MSISDIIMNIHKNYKLSDLTRLTENNFKEFYPHTAKDFESYAELDEFLKTKGLKASNLYYNIDMYTNCWYIDGEVILYMPYLMRFNIDMVDDERVRILQSYYDKAIQDKDWESYLSFKPDTFRVDIFKNIIRNFNIKKKDDLINIVKLVYGETNQIMDAMSKEELKDLLLGTGYKYKVTKKDLLDSKGLMTIYRGETSKSTKIEGALSYSRDINVACHFATFIRDEKPVLHIAKVKPKDILLDIDGGESEVLVDYADLRELKTINLYTMSNYYGEAEELFNKVKGLLGVVVHRKGIHGFTHSSRMLKLLCTMYVNGLKEEISKDEFNMLAIACCLHDLGRIHDKRDDEHGKNSLKYLEDVLKVATSVGVGLEKNNSGLIGVLKHVVSYHCLEDEIAHSLMEKHYNKRAVSRALKLLWLFKDLDNLDRVRTRDLKVEYLRNESAIKCLGLAKQFISETATI